MAGDSGTSAAHDSDMLRAYSILGNGQRLDGGAMFGNAPRAVWERWCPPDELGRIELACRALLIESEGQRILLETGIGAFFSPELRERYGVFEPEHMLLRNLAARGFSPEDIDFVVLSHLHFDHAGGLLHAFDSGHGPALVFPSAHYVVGKAAFERAEHPHARDKTSFIPELQALLKESGRLELVGAADDLVALLGPRFWCTTSDGHTPGLLHTEVAGERVRLFFCSDLVPGTPWVHVPITMGYDRFPERLIDEKARLFPELLARGTRLFFTHDRAAACAELSRDERGRYGTQAPTVDWPGAWDLDSEDVPRAA